MDAKRANDLNTHVLDFLEKLALLKFTPEEVVSALAIAFCFYFPANGMSRQDCINMIAETYDMAMKAQAKNG